MAGQNPQINVDIKAQWIGVEALIKELQDEIEKRAKSGTPIKKTATEQFARLKERTSIGKSLSENGADSSVIQPLVTGVLNDFRRLTAQLSGMSKEVSDKVFKLYDEIEALTIKRDAAAAKIKQVNAEGLVNPKTGDVTALKKSREDLVRNAAIPNRFGGKGSVYSTYDIDSLSNIQSRLTTLSTKEGVSKDDSQKYLDEVKAIQNVIDKLKTYDQTLTSTYKNSTAQVEELNKQIDVKNAEATSTFEEGVTDESKLETAVLTAKATDQLTESEEEKAAALEASNKQQQELNQSLEEGSEKQEKNTSMVGKAVSVFFGYQMAMRTLQKLWNDAIKTITELDEALTGQAIVTTMSREEAWALVDAYQALAKATGFTTTEIAAVATEYFKQGKTQKDVLILTEAAAKAAKVAGIDAMSSVEYLTTAINGFKLSAEDALAVSDKFASLAANTATDYDELATALSKVASQANLAGMSMDYTLGLLAKGIETTKEPAESIGTALKTVIARMREITDYGETLEDGISLNNVEKQLAYINIDLRDQQGQLRSTEDVLNDLGMKWDTLTTNQQAAIAKALAGSRQQSRLIAMMSDYERTLELVAISENSLGATTAQQADYLEGLEAATKRFQTSYQEFITSVTNNQLIIDFINAVSGIISLISQFLGSTAGMTASIGMVVSLFVAMLPTISIKIKDIWNKLTATNMIEMERLKTQKLQSMELDIQVLKLREQQAIQRSMATQDTNLAKQYTTEANGYRTQIDAKKAEYSTLNATKAYTPSAQEQTAKKVSATVAVASAAIAAGQVIYNMVQNILNATATAAADAIEKGTAIQSEIYENVQTKTTLQGLIDSFEELDEKVIKTADDLADIETVRENLLEQYTEEERLSKQNMTTAQLVALARVETSNIDSENADKLAELEDLMINGSKTSADWGGNIMTGVISGAALGGAVGTLGAAGTAGISTAVGAGVGAIGGLATSLIMSGIEQAQINDAKAALKEILADEDGLAQARYLYAGSLGELTEQTTADATRIKASYESLVNALDADELYDLMTNSGMTAAEVGALYAEIAMNNKTAFRAIDDTEKTYAERIEGLHTMIEALKDQGLDELADSFSTLYSDLLTIEDKFPTTLKYLDEFGWSIDELNDFLTAVEAEGLNGDELMGTIGAILDAGGTAEEMFASLGSTLTGLSSDVILAIAAIVGAGKTLQTIAEDQTSSASTVSNLRETQSNWGDMTAAEKQSYLADNASFFMTDGEFDPEKLKTFVEGGDITQIIEDAMAEEQATLIDDYNRSILGSQTELEGTQKLLEELYAAPEQDDEAIADALAKIEALKSDIAVTELLIEDVGTMFDLTLSDLIEKQQTQIDMYSDMLKAEQEKLIKSLDIRKQAYSDYFDAINAEYDTQEYDTEKTRLQSQITKLSGATDATSLNKIASLQKELTTLEKDRAETLRLQAQSAVLENIDNEIDIINDYYDELLDSNDAMLDKMTEQYNLDKDAYALEYRTYLLNSGKTAAEIEQLWKDFTTAFYNGVAPETVTAATEAVYATQDQKQMNTNYSFNINDKSVDFTQSEFSSLKTLLKQALQRSGVTMSW